MKTQNEVVIEAFSDIMYSKKTVIEVLNEVYESGFADGFEQGRDSEKD